MAKVLEASCSGGMVTVLGVTISDAIILSSGVGDSQGIAIIDKGTVFYVASSALDLVDLIEKLKETIDQVVTICTGIDSATNAPAAQASAIAQLAALGVEILALKDLLR